jgi:hypothetical protein
VHDVVPGSLEVGGDADPVVVHRHRERGGRRVVGDAALDAGQLRDIESPTAVVLGHRGCQVSDRAELVEVFGEVGVRRIRGGGAGAEGLEQLVGELFVHEGRGS